MLFAYSVADILPEPNSLLSRFILDSNVEKFPSKPLGIFNEFNSELVSFNALLTFVAS